MDENYKLLKDVVGFSYVIGSYQRGYRWDEVNVRELLEDIFEDKLVEDYRFSKNDYMDENEVITELNSKVRDTEYCLQPLVLKKNDNGYSVIDGQQRLTTLYIIMKALCSVSDKKFPIKFSIEYKSREKSKEFLQTLSEDSEASNIDAAYILQAYCFAKEWFLKRNKAFIDLLDENFVECDENRLVSAFATYLYKILLEKTKFIWDEIDESSADMNKKEQKIFADRNTGRLELTDSELIKSLFMNPEYYGKEEVNLKDRQTLISEIWDIYENELHNDELWKFLPISATVRVEYELLTRIDAIFLLLTKKNRIERNQYEENSLFKAVKQWIDNKIEEHQGTEEDIDLASAAVMVAAWREVCDLFDGIKELFDNNELYNLLSLYKMIEADDSKVLGKYLEVLEAAKNARTEIVKEAVCELLFAGGIAKKVKDVRYPDLDIIRKILVAHNVAITNSSNPINRFGFHFFDEITGKWDIEHIYSTNEGYIEKAPLEEKVKLLEIFSEPDNNIYKGYIEALYDVDIDELQGETEDKEFADQCFKNAKDRYRKEFDIWRYFKLKEFTRDLLFKYNVSAKITEILSSEHFDTAANDFLHNEEYDDQDVCVLFRSDYLYWDNKLEAEYQRLIDVSPLPSSILWHGVDIKVADPSGFWAEDAEEKNIQPNFIRNYYRDLLNIVYDNTGISAQDLSFGNHGKKKKNIVDDTSRDKIKAFLIGTKFRIEEKIREFFKKDESINPSDYSLGTQTNYDTLAAFINDNSMGNMMLLPVSINRAGKYRDVNFSGKRKFVVDKGTVFLPIATSNVLMGKYIDLETSTEQWLMNERKEYIMDMISSMSKYYGKE